VIVVFLAGAGAAVAAGADPLSGFVAAAGAGLLPLPQAAKDSAIRSAINAANAFFIHMPPK
jgi:hypothetical protein